MKCIDPARVNRAIIAIHEWWYAAHSQNAKHILPLLALLERGAGDGNAIPFEESDDYAFWDKYFRLDSETEKPYFNPLTRRLGEEAYPHSNAATIRHNTFESKWHAATRTGQPNERKWALASNYAEIFRDKALQKGGVSAPIPVIDFAALMLRSAEFDDSATTATLLSSFRERFPQKDDDFEKLFRFADEQAEKLFTAGSPTDHDYAKAIAETIVSDVKPPTAEPPDLAASSESGSSLIDEDDALLLQVRELLNLNSSGIILRGVPGTGKTWYARQIARRLVSDPSRIFEAQFHPSLGYEDFVEGYKPNEDARSGFSVVPKQFVSACVLAAASPAERFVYIIDEINRGEPARIFGDLLTFIEQDYRGREFTLPFSNRPFAIPANLVLIGTMNPYDRSITQLDSALIRRFDHIDVMPSSEKVGSFLEGAKAFGSAQVQRIQRWFDDLQKLLPLGIGHTYLKDVRQPEHLQLVWRYRMFPVCENALELDPRKLENVKASFASMYADVASNDTPDAPAS